MSAGRPIHANICACVTDSRRMLVMFVYSRDDDLAADLRDHFHMTSSDAKTTGPRHHRLAQLKQLIDDVDDNSTSATVRYDIVLYGSTSRGNFGGHNWMHLSAASVCRGRRSQWERNCADVVRGSGPTDVIMSDITAQWMRVTPARQATRSSPAGPLRHSVYTVSSRTWYLLESDSSLSVNFSQQTLQVSPVMCVLRGTVHRPPVRSFVWDFWLNEAI